MLGGIMSLLRPSSSRHRISPSVELVDSLDRVREKNALLFSRKRVKVDGWQIIPVSQVEGVSPLDLNRILHLSLQHLHKNGSPIVLDCIEYLVLYNGFRSVSKFLHNLRDYAFLHGSKLYIVTKREAWEPWQYSHLKVLANI